MLEMGADPNARDPAGRTSLHLAAVNGKIDISKKLLECGAKVRSVKPPVSIQGLIQSNAVSYKTKL